MIYLKLRSLEIFPMKNREFQKLEAKVKRDSQKAFISWRDFRFADNYSL